MIRSLYPVNKSQQSLGATFAKLRQRNNPITMAEQRDTQQVAQEISPKVDEATVEEDDGVPRDDEKAPPPQMRSKSDDLGVWEAVKMYKLVTLVGMCAAFSASLDGYRTFSLNDILGVDDMLTGRCWFQ